MPAPAPVMTAAVSAPTTGVPASERVSRPKIGQEISSEVTARRGASPMPLAHERRSSSAYRPQM